MIEFKNGRTISRRTRAEELAQLKKEMAFLNEEEREALEIMLQEVEQGDEGKSYELLTAFTNEEYKTAPVDMKTFVTEDHYLGNTCGNIYPKLLDDLAELFDGNYEEAIFTGSIGYGKTFTASIGICRMLYDLSCMRNPQASFGLAPGSGIYIVCLSVTETLATKVVFDNIAVKIDSSPYFRENFPYERTKKELRFPGNITIMSRASTDTSALGMNTIAAFIDETNFMPKGAKDADPRFAGVDRAEVVYNQLKRRMKSRFEKFGKIHAKMFIVSSKNTSDDFTAKRIREAKDQSTVFVRDYALWDVKPDAYFDTDTFWVLSGNEQVPSRVLDPGEEAKFKEKLPEGCLLIEVPVDFRSDFERDLEGALRDIAGVATIAVSPFIQRREKIVECIDTKREHPFTTLVYDASKGGSFRWDLMVQNRRMRQGALWVERLAPIINPHAIRHVHIDPALRNDSLGLCMAHIGGWTEVQRRDENGQVYAERAPKYVVDFLLRVVPPPGGEIVLGDIRRMVYDLAAHGYPISYVSADQFQSADMIQQLTAKGYTSEVLSVDITADPYDNVKTSIYEGRVSYYEYEPLLAELRTLEQKFDSRRKRKIDHPVKGSKDVSDALAGCLWSLKERAVFAEPLSLMKNSAMGPSAPDLWLEEQRHSAMAGNIGAGRNQGLDDYGGNGGASGGLLPMMFGTSRGRDDDEW